MALEGADGPGETRTDVQIMSELFLRLRQRYQAEGGAYPDAIMNISWPYKIPEEPSPEELAKEMNGWAVADVTDPTGAVIKAGQQLAGFGQLKDDGSTASGCWIFAGSWTEQATRWLAATTATRMACIRCRTGPGPGRPTAASFTTVPPATRKASRGTRRKKRLVWWNGKAWTGTDVPDFKVDSPPEAGMNPFIMNPEGVARFFAIDKMAEGPFPEHYEPFETPIGINPLHPQNKKATSNPAGAYSILCGTPSARTMSSLMRRPPTG